MERRSAFRSAWALYRAHARRTIGIAAVVYAVFTLVTALLVLEAGVLGLPFAALLWLTGSFWLQAPLAQLVADVRAERPPPPARETFDRLLPHLNTISLAGLLAAIGVYIGLYLLVLPGLFLLTRWSLLVPVIVLEDLRAFRAFARSRDLVRGHGLRVFGTIVATLAVLLAAAFAIAFLGGFAAAIGGLGDVAEAVAYGIAAFLVLTLVTPFVALVWIVTYLQRREARPPVPGAKRTPLPVADTLDEAWAIYKRHPSRLLVLGGLVAGLALAADAVVEEGWWDGVLPFAATLVGYVWLAGLLAEGLTSYEDAPARRWLALRFRDAAHRALPLLALGAIGAAAFSTVVGVALLVWWCVIAAAVVVEGQGVRDAFGRSRELVRGRRRRVVKLVFLSVFVAALLSAVLTAFVPPAGAIGQLVVAAIGNAVTAPYVALAWALMYRQLREQADAEPWETPAPAATLVA